MPLSGNPDFKPLIAKLGTKLRHLGVSSKVDNSGVSIGRRYARNDELGTPFGVTVDFQSVKDDTVTLRDRDTTKQVRSDLNTICEAIKSMVEGQTSWSDTLKKLPEFTQQEVE